MEKGDLIQQKINELILLAEQQNDLPVQSIMNALAGARIMHQSDLLCQEVSKIVTGVLMPKAKALSEISTAIQN